MGKAAASLSGMRGLMVMVGSFKRLAAAALFSASLAGCASTGDFNTVDARPETRGTHVEQPTQPLQCVPYARTRSGVNLRGDASTWWDEAAGHYARGSQPLLGSVLVLTGYAGPHRGHLAVVTAMDSDREIRVDHANWLNDGMVYRDDPVVDVSPDNDWTEVRVWNPRTNAWGTKTYLVQGFIGPGGADEQVASW
ncbi:MAG TPA: CHAP domain-containing protein [Rhizomicrobium sp.]|jgi:surface antigen